MIAHKLTPCHRVLAGGAHVRATTAVLRVYLINIPGRLARPPTA